MNEWEKLCLCHCSRSGLNAVLFRYNPNMRRPITFAAISEGNISRTKRGSAARSRHWQLGFNPLYFRASVSLKYYISLKYLISAVHFSWEEDFIGSPGGLADEEEQVLRLQKEVQGWRLIKLNKSKLVCSCQTSFILIQMFCMNIKTCDCLNALRHHMFHGDQLSSFVLEETLRSSLSTPFAIKLFMASPFPISIFLSMSPVFTATLVMYFQPQTCCLRTGGTFASKLVLSVGTARVPDRRTKPFGRSDEF